MAFDKPTRNRLASFVSEARHLVAEEFTQQFQSLYGISDKGTIAPLDQLGHLDDIGQATAALLRERIDYFIKTHPDDRGNNKAPVARLAREQAFTVLNRLAAIRMAEKRGLIVESVGKGYQSKGFKVFEQVAGSGLGDTYHRYRRYIFCLFDELAVDLGVLFDRRSPQGLLFPRETALLALFDILNASDLDPLWAEDETIGWIYQYYNDSAERKKMRDESAAPRNSRELAIRNQFFTPRYVVEFLTDNTLGRIWYEMTKGKTRLTEHCRYLVRRPTEIFLKPSETFPETPPQEGLSQEELLKQPVHIPHRPLKDPREIALLDPACGSMHFGLYAFDLFEAIYEESWDFGLESLRRDYPEKDTLLCEIPRLIIEHNIHGIDIDPRAVQIAGLSLWLRAQKSWQFQRIPAAERPRIMRSNVVCAEPMPGSAEMLGEFTATLNPPLLGQMVEKVFAQMQLAGEAGSLLKIEEEIAKLVKDAMKLWKTRPKAEQLELSLGLEVKQKQGELPLDVSGISDERFWDTAEERIYAALHAYSEQAESDSYQRRLFADDAARGFAFIDLCRKKYDVALMNPPFGEAPSNPAITRLIPTESAGNLYGAFVLRTMDRLNSGAKIGCITDRTFLLLPTYQQYRDLISSGHLMGLADLGWGVLDDAQVATCAYIVSSRNSFLHKETWFVDARQRVEKAETLLDIAKMKGSLFLLSNAEIEAVPTHPLTYWAPACLREAFMKYPPFEPSKGIVRKGLSPGDSNRFVMLWWEVPDSKRGLGNEWTPYANGGEFSPYYRASKEVVRWGNQGQEIRGYCFSDGRPRYVVRSSNLYGTAGLTFGKRGEVLNVQVLPAGQVFSNEGYLILPKDTELLAYLGFFNANSTRYVVNMICGLHKEVGAIKAVPVPKAFLSGIQRYIDLHARKIYQLIRTLSVEETNPEFDLSSVADAQSAHSIKKHLNEWAEQRSRACYLVDLEAKEIDQAVGNCYNVNNSLTTSAAEEINNYEHFQRKKVTESIGNVTVNSWLHECISCLLGISFGRWDIRFATDERQPPELPDPFAPLPVCPPGMLQNADGLPAEPKDVPADYPLRISWPGILVDDENHPEDIVARVREALEIIWKDRAEAIEHEACELLSVKTLRDYFHRPAGFFADHLKRYSKSRRQAPIYWPLSTAKGSYTLWIYYHRLTDQTLHAALADLIDPKLKAVRAEISALRESGNHRAHLEELLDLEKELSDFHAKIEGVIKLPWKPNLNDGVLITASPLWKLFRLPKWQKDLKACWEKLEKGEFDWAHLAYSIWPKRVEDVCKKDRSIAIAHGLEHLCQIDSTQSKGKRSKKKSAAENGEIQS